MPWRISRPTRRSSPTQWLPMITRSAGSSRCARSCTWTVGASVEDLGVLVDRDEAVGAAEGRDRAGALAHGVRGEVCLALHQADEKVLGAPALGVDAHRQRRGPRSAAVRGGRPAKARITGATNSWNVKIAEVGNPGRITTGLPSAHRQADRLAGLERHAVRDDARVAQAARRRDTRGRRRLWRCRPRGAPRRARGRGQRAGERSSSSGMTPRCTGVPPSSATAAPMIAALES